MTYRLDSAGQRRLDRYFDKVGSALGRRDRRESFALYAIGLFSDADRKSIEPIAAMACGDEDLCRAYHDQLLHFVGVSPWSDLDVRSCASRYALSAMTAHETIDDWIIDDTGFPKQGNKSPGVQRQYSGTLGKTGNCQIGVSVTVATPTLHLPIDMDLYLPRSWTDDRARCRSAHIPDDVGNRPKWQIALDLIGRNVQAGVPIGLMLADSGYGDVGGFRDGVRALGFDYAVDVKKYTRVVIVCDDGSETDSMSVETVSEIVGEDSYRKVTLSYDKRTQKDFFRDAPHGAAFQNVFLLVDPKTKQVREEPLRREHRVRSRYEFEYEKGAQPTRFLELLDAAFDGKPDKTECIRVVQQFTGASIVGLATKFQRAMIFRGKGNDAKSTLATILAKAMPAGTVSAVPPQSFGHPYSRAALDGMLLNCVSETPENDILDAGPLKAIITGDKIEARNPYERPFTMEPRAGLLLVLNNLFKVKDTSRAFSRRWVIIDFENEVENADRFKVEQIVEDVPAIVSWAIEGLRDLLANDYVLPASSQAAVDDWSGECDTVRQYVEAQVVPLAPEEKADTKITWSKGDTIYADYKTWVRDNGHAQPLTSVRFLRRLRTQLGMGKGEGHRNDGNYYPVRLRAVAEMIARAKEGDGIAVELHGWDPNGTGRENLMYRLQGAEAELAKTEEHVAERKRCNLSSSELKPVLAQQKAAVAAARAALSAFDTSLAAPERPEPDAGSRSARIFDPTLPHGDHEARVVRGNPDTGAIVLDVSLDLQAPIARIWHETSLRGGELESFVMSVIDERSFTIVTFAQVREGGNSIAKIVGLRRPAAMEKAS